MVYLSGLWAFWGQYNCILISCILGILNTYTVPGFANSEVTKPAITLQTLAILCVSRYANHIA